MLRAVLREKSSFSCTAAAIGVSLVVALTRIRDMGVSFP
jgi:hypothetical protein